MLTPYADPEFTIIDHRRCPIDAGEAVLHSLRNFFYPHFSFLFLDQCRAQPGLSYIAESKDFSSLLEWSDKLIKKVELS